MTVCMEIGLAMLSHWLITICFIIPYISNKWFLINIIFHQWKFQIYVTTHLRICNRPIMKWFSLENWVITTKINFHTYFNCEVLLVFVLLSAVTFLAYQRLSYSNWIVAEDNAGLLFCPLQDLTWQKWFSTQSWFVIAGFTTEFGKRCSLNETNVLKPRHIDCISNQSFCELNKLWASNFFRPVNH